MVGPRQQADRIVHQRHGRLPRSVDRRHNETAPGAGTLKVTFRSGDSGREIIQAIDVRGTGSDEEIVAAERPRWYYLTIDSAGVDWTVSVDERIDAQRVSR